MMPPPGCSPMAPSVSTRCCISAAVISGMPFAQRFDGRYPLSDVGGLEALIARLVETRVGHVVGQIALRPALGIVGSKVVTVLVVAAVPHATHQPRDSVAQMQRHRVVARVV